MPRNQELRTVTGERTAHQGRNPEIPWHWVISPSGGHWQRSSDSNAIAEVTNVSRRKVDSFLSEYFDVVAEIEMELLFRTPPEPFPETRALGKTARAYAHRFAPLHSFAVEHHRFFQDAEVLELIKERGDMRFTAGPHVAPRRRR